MICDNEGGAVDAGTSFGQPAAKQKPPFPHRDVNRLDVNPIFQDHDVMMISIDLCLTIVIIHVSGFMEHIWMKAGSLLIAIFASTRHASGLVIRKDRHVLQTIQTHTSEWWCKVMLHMMVLVLDALDCLSHQLPCIWCSPGTWYILTWWWLATLWSYKTRGGWKDTRNTSGLHWWTTCQKWKNNMLKNRGKSLANQNIFIALVLARASVTPFVTIHMDTHRAFCPHWFFIYIPILLNYLDSLGVWVRKSVSRPPKCCIKDPPQTPGWKLLNVWNFRSPAMNDLDLVKSLTQPPHME